MEIPFIARLFIRRYPNNGCWGDIINNNLEYAVMRNLFLSPKRCIDSLSPTPLDKRNFYQQELERCEAKKSAQIEAINSVFEAMREDGIISQADLVWMQKTTITNITRWYELHLQKCRKSLITLIPGGK